jgi:hypothetical protein
MVVHQGALYTVDHNENLLAVTFGEDDDGVTKIRCAKLRHAPLPRTALPRGRGRRVADGAERGLQRESGTGRGGGGAVHRIQGRPRGVAVGGWRCSSGGGDWGSRAVRAPGEHMSMAHISRKEQIFCDANIMCGVCSAWYLNTVVIKTLLLLSVMFCLASEYCSYTGLYGKIMFM